VIKSDDVIGGNCKLAVGGTVEKRYSLDVDNISGIFCGCGRGLEGELTSPAGFTSFKTSLFPDGTVLKLNGGVAVATIC